jgi:hypothetical protein
MADTNTTQPSKAPIPTLEELVKTLNTYDESAKKSLDQLQTNIDNATNQITEWKKIQLMIVGQQQLLKDLISRAKPTTPTTPAATNETK